MESYKRPAKYGSFRKMVGVFQLAQSFITILLIHLSVVFGVYLIIKSRYNATEQDFIQGAGVLVMVCGVLVSLLWRFIAKLATKRILILADIDDGLLSKREGFTKHEHGTQQELQR